MQQAVKPGRCFIGRFEAGDDLLAKLNEFCQGQNIRLGTFSVIGAVTCARLGYYNQQEKKYTGCVELDKKLEITACLGNISIKESEIFVHAHITLADWEGKAYGGHLMPGTLVFAAEFSVQEMIGPDLIREREEKTGLPLWKSI
jgi:hypothetical protein